MMVVRCSSRNPTQLHKPHAVSQPTSGINNVDWDAVELPSQFMENWCYDRPTLFGMARHYETSEPLAERYYQKLLAAKNYVSGSTMLRQLHFSYVDIELHNRYQPGGAETLTDVRKCRDTVIAPGGSQHPMDMFKAFRGRKPSTVALIPHNGLAKAS